MELNFFNFRSHLFILFNKVRIFISDFVAQFFKSKYPNILSYADKKELDPDWEFWVLNKERTLDNFEHVSEDKHPQEKGCEIVLSFGSADSHPRETGC